MSKLRALIWFLVFGTALAIGQIAHSEEYEVGQTIGPLAMGPGIRICDTPEQAKAQLRYPNVQVEGCGFMQVPTVMHCEIVEIYEAQGKTYAIGKYTFTHSMTRAGPIPTRPYVQYGPFDYHEIEGEGA